jgi:hypothetical protein
MPGGIYSVASKRDVGSSGDNNYLVSRTNGIYKRSSLSDDEETYEDDFDDEPKEPEGFSSKTTNMFHHSKSPKRPTAKLTSILKQPVVSSNDEKTERGSGNTQTGNTKTGSTKSVHFADTVEVVRGPKEEVPAKDDEDGEHESRHQT